MTSKEALKDIFIEALLLDKEKRAITNVGLFERKEQIERDLEVLQELKEILLKSHRIKDHVINQEGDEVKHEVVDTILPVIYVEGKVKEWLCQQ